MREASIRTRFGMLCSLFSYFLLSEKIVNCTPKVGHNSQVMKKNDRYPIKVAAVKMLDSGVCANKVCQELHVDGKSLKVWYSKYKEGGELALLRPEQEHHRSIEEKVQIIEDIVANNLSLSDASMKHQLDVKTLRQWRKTYLESGAAGLMRKNKSMAKKKVYTAEQLDELEMLRRRNEYLEAENALLKKVKALVEAREARLRATGRKPSKD